jgi:hypothetical protein
VMEGAPGLHHLDLARVAGDAEAGAAHDAGSVYFISLSRRECHD